jgi:uncharacterized protein (DUF4415 family)
MGKTVKKSMEQIRQEAESGLHHKGLKNLPSDKDINFDDIPALNQAQLEQMKPVGNRFRKLVKKSPRSQKVSIRFEIQVLERLKEDAAELGKPYQTHINDILRTYVAEQDRH